VLRPQWVGDVLLVRTPFFVELTSTNLTTMCVPGPRKNNTNNSRQGSLARFVFRSEPLGCTVMENCIQTGRKVRFRRAAAPRAAARRRVMTKPGDFFNSYFFPDLWVAGQLKVDLRRYFVASGMISTCRRRSSFRKNPKDLYSQKYPHFCRDP